MGRVFLHDCMPGDFVEDVFCVSSKQFSAASNGSHFIKVQVSDRTDQINARMWKATREIFNTIPDAGFIGIRGKLENYQSNLQLIIEGFFPARDGSFDIGDLLAHTDKDIPTMCRKVSEILGSIQNRHLSALMQAYLDDEGLMANLCKAPAAQSFHHAFIGGLLEHTLNAMEVADAIMKFYPGLNRDLVISGIFLHDIAKTWELSYDSAFGYTDGGHLVGHIVKSVLWVEEKARKAEEMLGEQIPRELIDALQHIILSHHGSPEFGAAKTPATPEAIAVHHIENMDAKLMSALAATRGQRKDGEGNWTEYLKPFGGRLYRPDVAPAETTGKELPPSNNGPSGAAGEEALPVGRLVINNPLFESVPPRK
jgi:3'-5' exoribonuclease